MKVRPLKGSTELPGNAPWATPCMRKGILVNTKYEKGSSLSNASWFPDIFLRIGQVLTSKKLTRVFC